MCWVHLGVYAASVVGQVAKPLRRRDSGLVAVSDLVVALSKLQNGAARCVCALVV